jgi:hypothetical protein
MLAKKDAGCCAAGALFALNIASRSMSSGASRRWPARTLTSGRVPRLRLALGPAACSVYLRWSIQLLPVCSCLFILLTVIDVQGSVHNNCISKIVVFLISCITVFQNPSSLMPLLLCPVLAWKIPFEENWPTGILSSPEFVSMVFFVYMLCFQHAGRL